jgi:hypothetical protein
MIRYYTAAEIRHFWRLTCKAQVIYKFAHEKQWRTVDDRRRVELSESEKLRDSSMLDTSALDGDPMSELAERIYAESAFNTGQSFHELPADVRRHWYRKAARQWLTP